MNILRDQYKALLNLSKNKDIVIMCPDKGSGVIIMNRTDYSRAHKLFGYLNARRCDFNINIIIPTRKSPLSASN